MKKNPEALYAELEERAEAATSICSATGDFLQYIYSVLRLSIIRGSDREV